MPDRTTDRGRQVATILVALGRDRASRMLSRFEPDELARLHALSGNGRGRTLPNVTADELDHVTRDFEAELAKGSGVLGAQSAFAALLAQASNPDGDVAPEAAADPEDGRRAARWEKIAAMEDTGLGAFLACEDARVAALVIARIGPDRAAGLLATLPNDTKEALLASLPDLAATAKGEDLVLGALEAHAAQATGQSRGDRPAELAALVNAMEPAAAEDVQRSLREAMAQDEWAEVEALIFHFADIADLDPAARALIVADIATDQLVLALQGAEGQLRDAVLEPLSQRLRRMVESELELAPPSGKAGLDARKSIAAIAVKLLSAGTISRTTVSG